MKILMKSCAALLLTIAGILPAQAQHASRKPLEKTAVVSIQLEPAVQSQVVMDRASGDCTYTVSAVVFRKKPMLAVNVPGYRLRSLRVSVMPAKGNFRMPEPWQNKEDSGTYTFGEEYTGMMQPGTTFFVEHIVIWDDKDQELRDQALIIVLK